MQNFKSNKQAKGFSLLELMLVLAAIVVLGAIVFQQYNKFRVGQQATSEAQNLAAAATGVKGLYTRGDYTSLNPEVASKAKFFPDSMLVSGTEIQNQWGGDVSLGFMNTGQATGTGVAITEGSGAPAAGSANRFFGISYAAVPSDVCIRLAGAANATFDKIVIDGVQVKNTVPGATTPELLDEGRVATNCGEDPVTMIFVTN